MKRKNLLQKKLICASLASALLLCSACGSGNNTSNKEPAADASPSEINNSTDDTNGNNDGQEAEITEQTAQISITFQTEKVEETEEDGSVIYTSVMNYPIVSIEGNASAAEKINADIRTRVDAFRSDTMTLDMAKEDYQYFLTDEPEYDFLGYSSDLDFVVTRSDSNVISFAATYSSFSGGAHGNYGSIGINYDTRTGELIDFANLGKDSESFRAATFAFLQELAATEFYQEQMFPGNTPEDLEAVLYADEKWYLSTSGLVFISDPYALAPYAAGMLNFTIPYSNLEEMGLKEEYQYTENLTIKLTNEATYTIDINGDQTDDTITFTTTYEESANGTSDFIAHLVINDVDVSKGYNDELSQLLSDNPWAECILYDMDASDNTIEIVLSTTQTDEATGNEIHIFSSFFRYEKDGSISYLGMTRGAVTDPTSDAYQLQF